MPIQGLGGSGPSPGRQTLSATEFIYQREKPELIGFTKSVNSGKDKAGRLRHHAVCGLLSIMKPAAYDHH